MIKIADMVTSSAVTTPITNNHDTVHRDKQQDDSNSTQDVLCLYEKNYVG